VTARHAAHAVSHARCSVDVRVSTCARKRHAAYTDTSVSAATHFKLKFKFHARSPPHLVQLQVHFAVEPVEMDACVRGRTRAVCLCVRRAVSAVRCCYCLWFEQDN
jgi:hypothetical protein